MSSPGRLPNFLILGAARSGTSSFAAALRVQPGIYMPPKRPEPHFFLRDAEYAKGLAYYCQRYFSDAPQTASVLGEASTSYLCHRKVAERIARDLPGVRLFALLRNPIERAFSSYWHTVKHGLEELSFFDALQAESSRALAAENDPVLRENRPFAYVERGLYYRQLRNFLDFIPGERISIILFEDYLQEPPRIMQESMVFLGIDPMKYVLPTLAENEINQSTPSGQAMDSQSYEFLREAFRDEVHQLSELLGRDLTCWLENGNVGLPKVRAA